MDDLKASDLREKLISDIDEARKTFEMLKQQLVWLDDTISSCSRTSVGKPVSSSGKIYKQNAQILPPMKDDSDLTVGSMLASTMEESTTIFNNDDIVEIVSPSFPDIGKLDLKRKCSQVAYRLTTQERIHIHIKGVGRRQNKYISNKYVG